MTSGVVRTFAFRIGLYLPMLLAASVLGFSCDDVITTTVHKPECGVPGESSNCYCDGGAVGYRECLSSLKYTECVCAQDASISGDAGIDAGDATMVDASTDAVE